MSTEESPSTAAPKRTYVVMVDDNFHYMDESARYKAGEFASCEEATRVCKQIVEESLHDQHKPPMTAEQLWERYRSFGEDPFIRSDTMECRFSAWDYAEQRCKEICGKHG
jgi:hypothetical protein